MANTKRETNIKKVKKQVKKGKKNKKQYRVRNWHEYNEALKQRGSILVWWAEEILDDWQALPSGKRGAQAKYSDRAIRITLQFGKVFGQRLRQTEGFVRSLFTIMRVDLSVPDFSTLCRRGATIKIPLPKDAKENLTLIVDSTGLKVYGEGEWKARKHGYGKHRTWRKFHLGVTPDGEIRAVELTDNGVGDNEVVPSLLAQESAMIGALAGDGFYDTREVYQQCQDRNIKRILIPPQKNARIWVHGNCHAPPHPRDENLRAIRKTSRKRWKETVGYHVRSLAETSMFRFKTVFGDRLEARNMPQQTTEVLIKSSILNRMLTLGMPDTYPVAA